MQESNTVFRLLLLNEEYKRGDFPGAIKSKLGEKNELKK